VISDLAYAMALRAVGHAAASLRGRMAETATLTRLGIAGQLSRTVSSTNPCNSMVRPRGAMWNCVSVGRAVGWRVDALVRPFAELPARGRCA
jgi:hypothetical protein